MMRAACMTLAVIVLSVVEARLVFPSGSDMGYIVPDVPEPENYQDGAKWLNDIEDYKVEPVRGEREALSSIKASLLHSLQDRMLEEERNFPEEQWQQQVDTSKRWIERESLYPLETLALHQDIPEGLPDSMKDDKHGVAMGISHVKCDNAKINLTKDWDFSPVNYTCFDPKQHRIPVLESLKPVQHCVELPKNYTPQHICMNREITYNSTLPTYGPHRPLWPVFGEYKFVPVQRWLHSLEHGGIVMLYDPCTEPVLVDQLRRVLTGCFRKHIITPYTLLTKERPLALLAWGCTLEMATVDEKKVKDFIKTRALHGPEGHYPKNGSYKEGLIRKADYPLGTNKDSDICPE